MIAMDEALSLYTHEEHEFVVRVRAAAVVASPNRCVGITPTPRVSTGERRLKSFAADGAGSLWTGDHIEWDCFFAVFADPFPRPPAPGVPAGRADQGDASLAEACGDGSGDPAAADLPAP